MVKNSKVIMLLVDWLTVSQTPLFLALCSTHRGSLRRAESVDNSVGLRVGHISDDEISRRLRLDYSLIFQFFWCDCNEKALNGSGQVSCDIT